MAGFQRVAQSSTSTTTASSYGSSKGGAASPSSTGNEITSSERFPAGLRVLVVDDDMTCLLILQRMLVQCLYHVTICSRASDALNLLRERKGGFDVVLSDVHMPDIDGFQLLELVGLEMDLPVIMMSADGRTSAVMRGVKHGACDYLIKPVREAELKNIWQHVVRKKWNSCKELEHSGSLADNDQQKRVNSDEYTSSVNEGTEITGKGHKKRSNAKEDDDGDMETDDLSTSKKPRVVWSVELHQQFVTAVDQLGLDKAVPKRILELMNVPGLTRENVASHLQKFRLYLKRVTGAAQQSGIANAFCGSAETNGKPGSLSRFDIEALAASGQIAPQTLAVLQAELLGQPTGSLVPALDQPALLHASLQGPKRSPVEQSMPFAQPVIKSQASVSEHFPQSILSSEDVSFGSWRSNSLNTLAPSNNLGGLGTQNRNMFMDNMEQEQREHKRIQQQSLVTEPSRSVNVQPSCLVVPSQSSPSFQAGNSPASVNQICSFNRSTVMDYSLLSAQSNHSPLNIGHIPNGNLKTSGFLGGYPSPCSISTTSYLVKDDSSSSYQNATGAFGDSRQFPRTLHNMSNIQGLYVDESGEMLDQGPLRNLGFVGKETCIPSRFAVDEFESQMRNLNHGQIQVGNTGTPIKQEPHMDFADFDNAKSGQQFSSSHFMNPFNE